MAGGSGSDIGLAGGARVVAVEIRHALHERGGLVWGEAQVAHDL
jgi:hypothetical protein